MLPDLVLEDYMLLGIYPFHPGCPVCWHTIVHNTFFYNPLYVFGASCYFSSFTSLILFIWVLSHFFFDDSGQRLVDFVNLFKEPAPRFTEPSNCSFSLYVI